MYQFRIMLLFILIGTAIYYKNMLMLGICFLLVIIWAISIPVYRKMRTSAIKEGIKNSDIKINVNRANWWEIALLPDVSDAFAKRVVWNRKKDGGYSTLDNFFARNEIENTEIIRQFLEV